MDEIEVRAHEDITKYHGKYYGFTIRQLISVALVFVLLIPLYLLLLPRIGDDMASWVVIVAAAPIVSWGFISIQGMNMEVFMKYVVRNYIYLYKPLEYKTETEIEQERLNKKRGLKTKKKKQSEDIGPSRKELRALKKKVNRELKLEKKEKKSEQKVARELQKAKKQFPPKETTKEYPDFSGLNETQQELLTRMAKEMSQQNDKGQGG